MGTLRQRDTLFSMKIPSLSLPSMSSIPTLGQMENFASSVLHKGVIGIDIGSSSAKIVQLSMDGKEIVLDTYGEMDLGPYGEREARKAVHLSEEQLSRMLADFMQAIDTTSRTGGLAVPLSASLIAIVDLPKREASQMDKIIAVEAKPFIPVPMDTVILNWYALSDAKPIETSIAALESKTPEIIEKEKVMLIATEKEVVNAFTHVSETVGIALEFLEVEFFSAARSSVNVALGPALILDLGASSTKLYGMNGHGVIVNTHTLKTGGEAVTNAIMKALDCNFEKAENAKRTNGLTAHADFTLHEQTLIKAAITAELKQIIDATNTFISETAAGGVDLQKIVLTGGGACLPGIVDAFHTHLKVEAVLANPFAFARGPIILEDVLKDVGPKFAVAMGIALRAIHAR